MTRPATGPTWLQFITMLVCCGIVLGLLWMDGAVQ